MIFNIVYYTSYKFLSRWQHPENLSRNLGSLYIQRGVDVVPMALGTTTVENDYDRLGFLHQSSFHNRQGLPKDVCDGKMW